DHQTVDCPLYGKAVRATVDRKRQNVQTPERIQQTRGASPDLLEKDVMQKMRRATANGAGNGDKSFFVWTEQANSMAKKYGPWEVMNQIGEGGQAHVYLVRDTRDLDAPPAALKRLRNKDRLDRFKREVEAALSLTHENILRIVDHGLDGQKPYFVAEYCQGD